MLFNQFFFYKINSMNTDSIDLFKKDSIDFFSKNSSENLKSSNNITYFSNSSNSNIRKLNEQYKEDDDSFINFKMEFNNNQFYYPFDSELVISKFESENSKSLKKKND